MYIGKKQIFASPFGIYRDRQEKQGAGEHRAVFFLFIGYGLRNMLTKTWLLKEETLTWGSSVLPFLAALSGRSSGNEEEDDDAHESLVLSELKYASKTPFGLPGRSEGIFRFCPVTCPNTAESLMS